MKHTKNQLMKSHPLKSFRNGTDGIKNHAKSLHVLLLVILFAGSPALCDQSRYTSSKAEVGLGFSVNSVSWNNGSDTHYGDFLLDVMLNPVSWFMPETTLPVLKDLDGFLDLQLQVNIDSTKLDEMEEINGDKYKLLFNHCGLAIGTVLKYQTLSFLDLFAGADYMIEGFEVMEVLKTTDDSIHSVSDSKVKNWSSFVGTVGLDLFHPDFPQLKLSFNMNFQYNKTIDVSPDVFDDFSMRKGPRSFVFTVRYSFRDESEEWHKKRQALKDFDLLCQNIKDRPYSMETEQDVESAESNVDDAWNAITHTSGRERQYADAKNALQERLGVIKEEEQDEKARIEKEKQEKEARIEKKEQEKEAMEAKARQTMLQEQLDALDSFYAYAGESDSRIVQIIMKYDRDFIQYEDYKYRTVSQDLVTKIAVSENGIHRMSWFIERLPDSYLKSGLDNELSLKFYGMLGDSSMNGRLNLFDSFSKVPLMSIRDSVFAIARASVQKWVIENQKALKALKDKSSYEDVLNARKDKIEQRLNGYRSYQIVGTIMNASGRTALIWGVAIPNHNTGSGFDPGVVYEKGNLKVIGYQDRYVQAGNVYTGGRHCFVSMATGKGRLGQSVDVHVYGACPGMDKLLNEEDQLDRAIEKTDDQIDQIKKSIDYDRINALNDSLAQSQVPDEGDGQEQE